MSQKLSSNKPKNLQIRYTNPTDYVDQLEKQLSDNEADNNKYKKQTNKFNTAQNQGKKVKIHRQKENRFFFIVCMLVMALFMAFITVIYSLFSQPLHYQLKNYSARLEIVDKNTLSEALTVSYITHAIPAGMSLFSSNFLNDIERKKSTRRLNTDIYSSNGLPCGLDSLLLYNQIDENYNYFCSDCYETIPSSSVKFDHCKCNTHQHYAKYVNYKEDGDVPKHIEFNKHGSFEFKSNISDYAKIGKKFVLQENTNVADIAHYALHYPKYLEESQTANVTCNDNNVLLKGGDARRPLIVKELAKQLFDILTEKNTEISDKLDKHIGIFGINKDKFVKHICACFLSDDEILSIDDGVKLFDKLAKSDTKCYFKNVSNLFDILQYKNIHDNNPLDLPNGIMPNNEAVLPIDTIIKYIRLNVSNIGFLMGNKNMLCSADVSKLVKTNISGVSGSVFSTKKTLKTELIKSAKAASDKTNAPNDSNAVVTFMQDGVLKIKSVREIIRENTAYSNLKPFSFQYTDFKNEFAGQEDEFLSHIMRFNIPCAIQKVDDVMGSNTSKLVVRVHQEFNDSNAAVISSNVNSTIIPNIRHSNKLNIQPEKLNPKLLASQMSIQDMCDVVNDWSDTHYTTKDTLNINSSFHLSVKNYACEVISSLSESFKTMDALDETIKANISLMFHWPNIVNDFFILSNKPKIPSHKTVVTSSIKQIDSTQSERIIEEISKKLDIANSAWIRKKTFNTSLPKSVYKTLKNNGLLSPSPDHGNSEIGNRSDLSEHPIYFPLQNNLRYLKSAIQGSEQQDIYLQKIKQIEDLDLKVVALPKMPMHKVKEIYENNPSLKSEFSDDNFGKLDSIAFSTLKEEVHPFWFLVSEKHKQAIPLTYCATAFAPIVEPYESVHKLGQIIHGLFYSRPNHHESKPITSTKLDVLDFQNPQSQANSKIKTDNINKVSGMMADIVDECHNSFYTSLNNLNILADVQDRTIGRESYLYSPSYRDIGISSTTNNSYPIVTAPDGSKNIEYKFISEDGSCKARVKALWSKSCADALHKIANDNLLKPADSNEYYFANAILNNNILGPTSTSVQQQLYSSFKTLADVMYNTIRNPDVDIQSVSGPVITNIDTGNLTQGNRLYQYTISSVCDEINQHIDMCVGASGAKDCTICDKEFEQHLKSLAFNIAHFSPLVKKHALDSNLKDEMALCRRFRGKKVPGIGLSAKKRVEDIHDITSKLFSS